MRITELFNAKAIALDVPAANRDEIIAKLVELQTTHGNITDAEAYKKALYVREADFPEELVINSSPEKFKEWIRA